MENQGRLGTNARARTGHIAGHGERVESNGGSERSREGRSAACASAKWSAREGRGGWARVVRPAERFSLGVSEPRRGAGRAPEPNSNPSRVGIAIGSDRHVSGSQGRIA